MQQSETELNKLSAKALLATQQRIPGLENGFVLDILFNARIHPKRKISTITTGEMEKLFLSVKKTLLDMKEQGGRNTEKDSYGNYGGYNTFLSNKTVGTPCRLCGDTILRESYLGGNIYFCPTCQPL